MYSRIIFYGLAGLWWGCLFGCFHVAMSMTETAGPRLLLADVGLTGSVSAVLGLLVGCVLTFVPRRLRMLSLFATLKAHLFPSADKALHFRSRTVATAWVSCAFLTVIIQVLTKVYSVILTRVQEPLFGAMSLTLFGVLTLSLMLAFAGVIRSVISRSIELVVRRFPALSVLCNPFGNLLTAILFCGLSAGLWLQDQNPFHRAEVLPFVTPISLLCLTAISGEVLEQLLIRMSTRRARLLLIGGIFFVSTASIAGLRSTNVQDQLANGYSIPSTVLQLLQRPFDEDGDGFAPILGGGDCDDGNPLIHPAAVEIYGNKTDENCDGFADTQAEKPKSQLPKIIQLPKQDRPLNIVLITISDLRPDHLSFFGYTRQTTPNLDVFSSDSLYFTNAYSASPSLTYGLASIHTGQHASELRRTDDNWPIFDKSNRFLAPQLKSRGYKTAAFLSHWYFDEGSGLEKGFDLWRPRVVEKGRTTAVAASKIVFDRGAQFLQDQPTNKPFFLWVHSIDPKRSYLEHLDIPRFGRDVISQYDHEIRYVDEMMAPFLSALQRRSDWSRTIVILTSEKGSDFGETIDNKGLMPLAEVQQKVPLFIRIPGVRARPIRPRISLTRLFPTVLELARRSRDPLDESTADVSLLRMIDQSSERKDPVLTEMLTNKADQFSLSYIEDGQKLLYDGMSRRWRLYDLNTDPKELKDQYAERPKLAHRLRRSLARFRSNMTLVAPK